VASGDDTILDEIGVHARTPISLLRQAEALADMGKKQHVFALAFTCGAVFPSEITTLADFKSFAKARDREICRLSFDRSLTSCGAFAKPQRCGDGTVTLKVKYADFQIITRCRSETDAIPDHATLTRVSLDLLAPLIPVKKGVRLLGISLSSLRSENANAPPQMTLAL
jgi:nucleotidyltransferase/DNA polymerase involved in DNA repair